MGEKEDFAQIKKDLVDVFANNMSLFGLNHTMGVVMGTIVFEGRPLNMAEISERTGYSLSTVSPHLNTLEMFGNIKRKKIKGISMFEVAVEFSEMNAMMKRLNKLLIQPNLVACSGAEEKISKLKKTDDIKNTLKAIKGIKNMYLEMSNVINLHTSASNKSKGGKAHVKT